MPDKTEPTQGRYPPKIHERAVRMVVESARWVGEHTSNGGSGGERGGPWVGCLLGAFPCFPCVPFVP